jgi:hypothetical protein
MIFVYRSKNPLIGSRLMIVAAAAAFGFDCYGCEGRGSGSCWGC